MDWNNDGEYDESEITGSITHDFDSAGIYTIRIRGNFPAFYSSDPLKILSVDQWGDIKWKTFNSTFLNAENLNVLAKDAPDLLRVTDMSGMFSGASSFNGDIGSWDVSSVTNMNSMFWGATSFNKDIGNWDVGNVINMNSIFTNATSFNQDIGNWDVSSVIEMRSVFSGARSFNQDIGRWDVSNVTNMYFMFNAARSFNQDISAWDVSNVTNMRAMFAGDYAFNHDISEWNVGQVRDMEGMFLQTRAFNQDIGKWDIKRVTNMKQMLDYSGLSIENYDNTLIGWAAYGYAPTHIYLKATGLQYCMGRAARNNLIQNYSWAISGDAYANNCFDQSSFIITIKTDNPGSSDSTSFTLPTNEAFTYSFDVDWDNDGIFDQNGISVNITHNFGKAGTYTIRIRGSFPAVYFNNDGDRLKILSVDQWGDVKWESFDHAFAGAENLNVFATDEPDLSIADQLSFMFQGVSSFNQDIGSWNLSQVTNMSGMLDGTGLTIDNYDNTLIGWSSGGHAPAGISLGASGLQYCQGKEVRDDLINSMNWTISGDNYSDKCYNQSPFIITIITNNPGLSDSTSFTIPVNSAYSYDYEVDWNNDGIYDQSGITGSASHNYGASGNYTIRIRGDFPYIYFNHGGDRLKLLSIDQWGDIDWESFNSAFNGAENLTSSATDVPDLSRVEDMYGMFSGASSFNGEIGNWDVSNVVDMSWMFYGASSFNGEIGNWDVSNVVDMNHMFNNATSFNHNLSDWDISAVIDMAFMFQGANAFNQYIGSWDVREVKNMQAMFSNATAFNQAIGNWNVSNVADMSFMFDGASAFNQDIGSWNVGTVTRMIWMFRNVPLFDQNIGKWNVSHVTELYGMFSGASAFNQDISDWDVSNVTNMTSMFSHASSFNQDIGIWDVGNVTDMSSIFWKSTSFNQDISDWDVGNVTNMNSMFSQASSFNQDLGVWDINQVEDLRYMLDGASLSISNYDKTLIGWATDGNAPSDLVLGAEGLQYCKGKEARQTLINDYGWTIQGDQYTDCDTNDYDKAFIITIKTDILGSSDSTSFTISINNAYTYSYEVDWNNDGEYEESDITGETTHDFGTPGTYTLRIRGNFPAFYSSDNLKILSVDQWGDNKWKTFKYAFLNAENLNILANDAPDLSQVIDMSGMFWRASSLNVDIGGWNVSNVVDMSFMFNSAKNFNHDIGGWDVSNVTNMNSMFSGASTFNQDISKWDVSKVRDMSSMFYIAKDFNQEIGNWNVGNVETMENMFNSAISFNGDISDWNVSNVISMEGMFIYAHSFNQNIGNWNVSNVRNMYRVLAYATSFNQNIGNWEIRNVTNMKHLLDYTDLSIENYDNTLIGWATNDFAPFRVLFTAFGLQYCNGKAARQNLIENYNWAIIGDDYVNSCLNQSSFIITIKTDNVGSSDSSSFTIPTNSGYNYSYDVDWDNDGIFDQNGISGNITHKFGKPGTYTIRIRGNFPTIFFNNEGDRLKVLSVDQWGDLKWESFDHAFAGAENLKILATDEPDLSLVENLSHMFQGASSFNKDIGSWDITKVSDMSSMLDSTGLSIENYDNTLLGWYSGGHAPAGISLGASGLQYCRGKEARDYLINSMNWTISGDSYFDKCTNQSPFIITIKTDNPGSTDSNSFTIPTNSAYSYNYEVDWNNDGVYEESGITGNVNHDFGMPGTYTIRIRGDFPSIKFNLGYADRKKILSIDQWGDIAWETFNYSFYGTSNLILNAADVPDLSRVQDTRAMFALASSFNGNIADWDVSNVVDMSSMFAGASSFNGDIRNWDVSNVVDMNGMFSGASSFNQDISIWDVRNVTDMSWMFTGASSFNQDISIWDVSKVYDMFLMFREAISFNHDIGKWDVRNVSNMGSMLELASSFNQDIGGWDISKVINMDYMLQASGLSVHNYDKTLIGWATNGNAPKSLVLGAQGIQYCNGKEARQTLIDDYGWTIQGDQYTDCDSIISDEPFIITIKTDNPGSSDSISFTIPTNSKYTYHYEVDWDNDGIYDDTGVTGNITHQYDTAGIYTIRVQGDFPAIYFNNEGDKEKILSVDLWGDIAWETFENAFQGTRYLTSSATDAPDLSRVTSLRRIFSSARFFNGTIGHWDVSNVEDMAGMFSGAISFNGNIGNWDVSKVENMKEMFWNTLSFNQDISNWDVSHVRNMLGMFRGAIFNQNIGNWDVSNVEDMADMFRYASSFNQNIGKWDVSNVQNMNSMFFEATSFNQDIGRWDVSSVEDMSLMFGGTSSFNMGIGKWDVSNVKEMIHMFARATVFDQNIGKWDVSNVNKMFGMFSGASSFNQDISKWDVSNVKDMSSMFFEAISFNQDLGEWNVSNVEHMIKMFSGASSFDQFIGSWNISGLKDYFGYEYNDGNPVVTTGMERMLDSSGLSLVNYDATLSGWAMQDNVPFNIALGAAGLQYCKGKEARQSLINSYGWTIIGDQLSDECDETVNEILITIVTNPEVGGVTTGSGKYQVGDTVTITATANEGYEFVNWTEGDTVVATEANYFFTIKEGRDLVANFIQIVDGDKYLVTTVVEPKQGGKSTGGGYYALGETATLTAISNEGYLFEYWTYEGKVISTDSSFQVRVGGDWTFVAHFEPVEYQITVDANPMGGGMAFGAGNYFYGDTVTVIAESGAGYSFLNWTDDGEILSTDSTYTFVVTGGRNLIANFTQKGQEGQYLVSTVVEPKDGGITTGGGYYDPGETATITASPSEGYAFEYWTYQGQVISTDSVFQIMVGGDWTFEAHFEPKEYQITANVHPEGSGLVFGTGSYFYGDTAVLIAESGAGFRFGSWTENDTVVSTEAYYSFIVTRARELDAHFELTADESYTINTSSFPEEGGEATGGGIYDLGDTVVVTAAANEGYEFSSWTENDTMVSTEENYAFIVASDRDLVAHFNSPVVESYTVKTSSDPEEGGETTGSGTYGFGDVVIVSAPANKGYEFINWTESDTVVATEANYFFNITGDRDLIAHFKLTPAESYTVTTRSQPEAGGETIGGGIYDLGDTVDITAVANEGYLFVNWTENDTMVSREANYSFIVAGDRDFAANFLKKDVGDKYLITTVIEPQEGGETIGGDYYDSGETATITATPNEGYEFEYWTYEGQVISTDSVFQITVGGNWTFVAHFEPKEYHVTTIADPIEGGNVFGSGSYLYSFYSDTAVIVIAEATPGYSFVNWTENDTVVSTEAIYSFFITGDRDLVAHFELTSTESYTVTVSSDPEEGGMATGSGTYESGDTVIVAAAAKDGYEFVHWTENDTIVSTDTVYSFFIAGDRDLIAHFELTSTESYTVIVSSDPEEGGLTTGSGTYESGDTVIVTAVVKEGYEFVHWTENDTIVSTDTVYSFIIVGDRDLIAHFKLTTGGGSYTVTTNSNPEEGGLTTGAGTYESRDTVIVTATEKDGYTFMSWTENGIIVAFDPQYQFEIKRSRNLTANFLQNYYKISVHTNTIRGGSATGGGKYNQGDTVQLVATTHIGYRFVNWTEEGEEISQDAIFRFSAIIDRNIQANFELKSYQVNIASDPEEGGKTYGSGNYEYGEYVTVKAEQLEGYVFVNWTENGEELTQKSKYNFLITRDRNLIAHFAKEELTAARVEKWDLSVYPNPVQRSLNIISSQFAIDRVELINLFGKVVLTKIIENRSREIRLDVGDLWSGMYILRLKSGSNFGEIKILKID